MAHNKRMGIRAGKLLGLRSSDDLGDGGDAARAGGKGSGVVAGGVLDGVGVVAGGGGRCRSVLRCRVPRSVAIRR